MGKLAFILNFILAAFPTDVDERRHVHVVRPGKLKRGNRGDVIAKIWIEKDGIKDISIDWSCLSSAEEQIIVDAIDSNWDFIENQLVEVFKGNKVKIIRLK